MYWARALAFGKGPSCIDFGDSLGRNEILRSWVGSEPDYVLASGIWAVTVYLFPARNAESKSTEVEARCGSVAVGGSVSGSNVIAGTTARTDCATKLK